MRIQINTDNNIEGREELAEQAEATVESTLGHGVPALAGPEAALRSGALEKPLKGGTPYVRRNCISGKNENY